MNKPVIQNIVSRLLACFALQNECNTGTSYILSITVTGHLVNA